MTHCMSESAIVDLGAAGTESRSSPFAQHHNLWWVSSWITPQSRTVWLGKPLSLAPHAIQRTHATSSVRHHRQLATHAAVAPSASNQDDSRTAAACSPRPIHSLPNSRASRASVVTTHCSISCGFDDTFESQRLAASTHVFEGVVCSACQWATMHCNEWISGLFGLSKKQLLQPDNQPRWS